MSAAVIDGKAFAVRVRGQVAAAVPGFVEQVGRAPGLAVVLVGDDAASQVYVRWKGKATVEAGMTSFSHVLPSDTTQDELVGLLGELNADPRVDGILVQLPLPKGIGEQMVIAAIDPAKDVDGFHPINVGRLSAGLPALVACTPLGCLAMLKDRLGDLSGLDAVVIGRSNIVGKPMAQLLLGESCTVTIAHSRTRDLPAVVRRADIVVAAVGRPEMVKGDWIKPGATVIDVGINRVDGAEPGKTRLVGDVDFAGASQVASAITPVPGGVGPMTIAMLLRNTVVAAFRREGLEAPATLWMIELFVSAFATLFVVIDPPGCAPIFASLTQGGTIAHRRAMAVRSVLVAAGILLFFAAFGEGLLGGLGISLHAFKIAGGIMLFLIALEMVFEKRQERRSTRAEEVKKVEKAEDISVFPMGIPMIAGPGSIASVMLLMGRADGWAASGAVLAALAANLILVLLSLLAASTLMRLVGDKVEGMITRLLGVILAALAVQFVLDGIAAALIAGRAA